MDYEIVASGKARLYLSSLAELRDEQSVIDYGAIMVCRHGAATVSVDFKRWRLEEGAVITLFPNDVVMVSDATPDFLVEQLRYNAAQLREASLQMEHTVYSTLRNDRCRGNQETVRQIVDGMFHLLRLYFEQPECRCTDQLVLCQLKAFFIGFYDWIVRNANGHETTGTGSRRMNELFNRFMELLENDYRQSHDVSYYAERLCITPKYLNTITKSVAEHTPKVIIDHYVVLQLKLLLRRDTMTIKQMAWAFHFSDTSFFCRYFKQHTGQSPQAFRRRSANV